MITKLTKEQEEQLVVYRDKWLAIGLSTDRIDREKAIKKFIVFNRLVLDNKKVPVIVFMNSPVTSWLATLLLYNFVGKEDGVQSQVWSQVRSQVGSQVESFIWPYLDGHFFSSYFSFYEFCNKVLKISFNCQRKWNLYLQTSDLGLIYPFEDFVVISEKPTEIKMKNMVLHNDGGPSIEYADGFCVWSLNGVRVTKEIAETPANKLDPKLVLTEQNAEVRRELVRKIDIVRVIQKLGAKILDKQGEYELLGFDIGDGNVRPYLKMRNPSIKAWHVEGVHPDCLTIEKALNWRNGTDEKPFVIT